MTPEDRILLRSRLLQALNAVGDGGRTELLLHTDARIAGFDLALPVFRSELLSLCDLGWLAAFEPMPGLKRYRLTALGQSKAAEIGL